jgi:hypothetical protein
MMVPVGRHEVLASVRPAAARSSMQKLCDQRRGGEDHTALLGLLSP